jgi:hypothetical protein
VSAHPVGTPEARAAQLAGGYFGQVRSRDTSQQVSQGRVKRNLRHYGYRRHLNSRATVCLKHMDLRVPKKGMVIVHHVYGQRTSQTRVRGGVTNGHLGLVQGTLEVPTERPTGHSHSALLSQEVISAVCSQTPASCTWTPTDADSPGGRPMTSTLTPWGRSEALTPEPGKARGTELRDWSTVPRPIAYPETYPLSAVNTGFTRCGKLTSFFEYVLQYEKRYNVQSLSTVTVELI